MGITTQQNTFKNLLVIVVDATIFILLVCLGRDGTRLLVDQYLIGRNVVFL